MRISVIIAAYNAERYLAETLGSVLAQTYQDWDLILIDDGSRDDTAAIGQGYAARDRRIRVISQANGGVSSARNRGIAELGPDTEVVSFLDADDVWEPEALQTLAAALAASPEAAGAHGIASYMDAQGQPCRLGELEAWSRDRQALNGSRIVTLSPEAPTTFAALAFWNCITVGSALVRRSALAASGGFDTSLTHCEDWDWWLRLARQGDFAFVDRRVLRYRQHDSNAMQQTGRIAAAERAVIRARGSDPASTPEQRHLVREGYRRRERTLGRRRLLWAKEGLGQHRFVEAIKHLLRAARNYAHSFTPLSFAAIVALA